MTAIFTCRCCICNNPDVKTCTLGSTRNALRRDDSESVPEIDLSYLNLVTCDQESSKRVPYYRHSIIEFQSDVACILVWQPLMQLKKIYIFHRVVVRVLSLYWRNSHDEYESKHDYVRITFSFLLLFKKCFIFKKLCTAYN